MELDRTVIILIGAGVCCAVIGLALFIKLLTIKPDYDEEGVGKKKLLDEEYADNFEECFENTGNIEGTLDQLANIYTGNQFMYNLIVSAIDYLNDDEGDYETALEKINVDSDINIMKMHNAAIRKALNIETKTSIKKDDKVQSEYNAQASETSTKIENPDITQEYTKNDNGAEPEQEEYFDEDEEEPLLPKEEIVEKEITKKINSDLSTSKNTEDTVEDFEDDLEDFKI